MVPEAPPASALKATAAEFFPADSNHGAAWHTASPTQLTAILERLGDLEQQQHSLQKRADGADISRAQLMAVLLIATQNAHTKRA